MTLTRRFNYIFIIYDFNVFLPSHNSIANLNEHLGYNLENNIKLGSCVNIIGAYVRNITFARLRRK